MTSIIENILKSFKDFQAVGFYSKKSADFWRLIKDTFVSINFMIISAGVSFGAWIKINELFQGSQNLELFAQNIFWYQFSPAFVYSLNIIQASFLKHALKTRSDETIFFEN